MGHRPHNRCTDEWLYSASRFLARYRECLLPPSPLLICSWRSASNSSSTRNSSSVMSASVIVSPILFAFRSRKHRRTRAPFGVSNASSSRSLGQPGPWLTSRPSQPAPQAGQPSSSVCSEYPHRRQRKTRSGHSSSGPHSPPWCRTRSEEHTSELQSLRHLVCRLLLEKK